MRRLRPFGDVELAAIAIMLACVQAIGGIGSAPLTAQQPDDVIAFDIPAQSLDTALARYSAIAGVQLLYDASLAAGRRSAALRGDYPPREALRRLLAGTGLIVRYSRNNAATLVAQGSPSATSAITLGRVVVQDRIGPTRLSSWERLAYYRRLEGELLGYLSADERIDHQAFHVVVALRIDEHGRITGLRLAQGSGSRATDATVIGVLSGAAVSPPPIGLTQPLAIALTGRRGR